MLVLRIHTFILSRIFLRKLALKRITNAPKLTIVLTRFSSVGGQLCVELAVLFTERGLRRPVSVGKMLKLRFLSLVDRGELGVVLLLKLCASLLELGLLLLNTPAQLFQPIVECGEVGTGSFLQVCARLLKLVMLASLKVNDRLP